MKQQEALQLKIAGATYAQIAESLGYNSAQAAHKAIHSLLDRQEAAVANEYRHIELARREMLWFNLQALIRAADVPAMRLANRILDSIDLLLGLRERPGIDVNELHAQTMKLAREMAESAGLNPKDVVASVEAYLRGEEIQRS